MAKRKNRSGPAKCLRPGCKSEVYARGLCHPDYQRAHYAVSIGKTTWTALEKAGKALARARGVTDPWLAEALENGK